MDATAQLPVLDLKTQILHQDTNTIILPTITKSQIMPTKRRHLRKKVETTLFSYIGTNHSLQISIS